MLKCSCGKQAGLTYVDVWLNNDLGKRIKLEKVEAFVCENGDISLTEKGKIFVKSKTKVKKETKSI